MPNLANYTLCPLAGGLFFHAALRWPTPTDRVAYYLLVFAAYLVTLGLNFMIVAGHSATWSARP